VWQALYDSGWQMTQTRLQDPDSDTDDSGQTIMTEERV
jgi:hypothetical protein